MAQMNSHAHKKLPSKYSMCHSDECYPTDNELLGCSELKSPKGKMGNHKVNVIGSEGGLL